MLEINGVAIPTDFIYTFVFGCAGFFLFINFGNDNKPYDVPEAFKGGGADSRIKAVSTPERVRSASFTESDLDDGEVSEKDVIMKEKVVGVETADFEYDNVLKKDGLKLRRTKAKKGTVANASMDNKDKDKDKNKGSLTSTSGKDKEATDKDDKDLDIKNLELDEDKVVKDTKNIQRMMGVSEDVVRQAVRKTKEQVSLYISV